MATDTAKTRLSTSAATSYPVSGGVTPSTVINPAKDRIAYYDGPEFHSPYATLYYDYSQRIKQCGGPGQLRRSAIPATHGLLQAFWQHIQHLNLDVHADSVLGADEATRLAVLHSNTPSPRVQQRRRRHNTTSANHRQRHQKRAATCERVPVTMDDVMQIVRNDEPSTEDALLTDLITNRSSPFYVPTHWSDDAQALKLKCLFRKESMKPTKVAHQFRQLSFLSEFITHIEPTSGQQLANVRDLALCANYIQEVNFAHLPPQLQILELYGNCIESDRVHGSVPTQLQHLGLGLNRLKNVGFLLATLPGVAAAAAAAQQQQQNVVSNNTLTVSGVGGGGSSSQPSSSFSLQQLSNTAVMLNSRRSSIKQQQQQSKQSAGAITRPGSGGRSLALNSTNSGGVSHRTTSTQKLSLGDRPASPATQLQRSSSLPVDQLLVFQNLTSLDVSQNRIDDVRNFIDCLQYLKALRILRAFGNPMALGRLYRGLLVDALSDELTFVDDARVLFAERQTFRGLYETIFKSGTAANNNEQQSSFGRNSAAAALARQVNTATLQIVVSEVDGNTEHSRQQHEEQQNIQTSPPASRRALSESLKNKSPEEFTEYPVIQYEYVLQILLPKDCSLTSGQQQTVSYSQQQQRRSNNANAINGSDGGSEPNLGPLHTSPPPPANQAASPSQPPMLIDPNQAPMPVQQTAKFNTSSLTFSTITEDIYTVHNIPVQTLQKPLDSSTSTPPEGENVADKPSEQSVFIYNTSDLIRLRDYMCCGMQVNIWERQLAYVPVTFFKHYSVPSPSLNAAANNTAPSKSGKKTDLKKDAAARGGRDSSASKATAKDTKGQKGGKKSGKEPKLLPLSELASYTVYYRFVGSSILGLHSLLECNASSSTSSNEININFPVKCLVYNGEADKRHANIETRPNVYFVLAENDRRFIFTNGVEGGPSPISVEQQMPTAPTKVKPGKQQKEKSDSKSPPPSTSKNVKKLTSPSSVPQQTMAVAGKAVESSALVSNTHKAGSTSGNRRSVTSASSRKAAPEEYNNDVDFHLVEAMFSCRITVVQENSTAEAAQRFTQR